MKPDAAANSPLIPLVSLGVETEADIVSARQTAWELALRAGLGSQDQARLATAVSEIARNALQYAGSGHIDFKLDNRSNPAILTVEVTDNGPGLADAHGAIMGTSEWSHGMGIGLSGSRRLMDHFKIESAPGTGTKVIFGKTLPASPKALIFPERLRAGLPKEKAPAAHAELQQQNRELLQALESLRLRDMEIEARNRELARLNLELEETNRGVVALYAELDEKADALKRANEMKSHFLRYVSHEFRTPVNSVLALTRLLLRRMDGDLTSEQEKQVEYIRRAVQELAEMVNDLLDLAKVEAGKTEVRNSRVDLVHFVGSIRALMRPLATNDAVSLIFEGPPAVTFETDESKLGQILRNMISNALKFTEHGEVRVWVRIDPKDSISFSVSDTGVGIAAEDLGTIFQEFTQVSNRLQKNVKGTGLGLPLSRKLATLLGGALEASSTLGRGSTFCLTLPLSTSVSEREVYETSDAILVIDDEETSRYITRQLFRGTRYRIIEASSGAEGTERARFEQPALIILDLVMPHQSGFDVLDELKGNDVTGKIPIVIQTSKKLTDFDFERLGARPAAVLQKGGADRVQALSVIRQILGESHLFQQEPEFAVPELS